MKVPPIVWKAASDLRRATKKSLDQLPPEATKKALDKLPPKAVKEMWGALPPEAMKKALVNVPPEAVKDALLPQTMKKALDKLPPEAVKEMWAALPPGAMMKALEKLPWKAMKMTYDKRVAKNMLTNLSNYWNYFNYGLLEHVVTQFGDSDLKQKMESYVSKLDTFKQKTKLIDFVQNHHMLDHMRKQVKLKQLVVTYECPDWSCCTLSQVEELTRALMNDLQIPKESLFDVKIPIDACVSVTWIIPQSAVSAMEGRMFHTPCDFFKSKGISLATLGEHVCYTDELTKLDDFAKELRWIYDVEVPNFLELQWPPPPTRKVFNLSMIHSKSTIRRQPPNEELVKLLQRGNVKDCMGGENAIHQDDLFKQDNCKHKVVLLEGAPGAGKSTLAWDICQKWKAQETFRNFQIVIYVQLRDPQIQSATTLADLLPLAAQELKERVTTKIETCRGIRALFVLDGWDEYEPGLKQGSLFHKLICKPHMLQLHNSTVLITSRPIASSELQPYATSRVEILGFTQEELRRYFCEALRDPAQVRHLYEQFEECPVIEASCYLPLNAAIVAHIFMELSSTLPRTLYGVFSTMVCGCIRRCLKKQTGSEEEIPSLDQISPYMQKEFQGLCTLAYNGSMANKVTFSGQELENYGLSSKGNVLDLMQVVQSFASRTSKLCHFLHLSVQELLTARHISRWPLPEQAQVFQNMFNNPRFAAVFRFYAASTKLQSEGIRDIVARIAQNREAQPLLNIMHCLYEAQDVSLCCFVASQLNGELDLFDLTLNPLDCLSVGYFLSCLYQYSGGDFTIKLTNSLLSSSNSRFLAKGLSSCSDMEESDPNNPPHPCITMDLADKKMYLHADGYNNLFQCLKTNISVIRLNLCNCDLAIADEDNGPLLEEMLRENRTLQGLNLSDNLIGAGELGYIAKGLKHNTRLAKLILDRCSVRVTADNGPLLEEMLWKNRTLKELQLSNSTIGVSGLRYIAKGLRHNTGLVKLLLDDCSVRVTEDNGPLLKEMLRENKTLQELDLSHNHVGASALGYIAKGLRHNTGLMKLSLCDCSMSVRKNNGPLLEEMLRDNRTLQELNLARNRVESAGIGYLAEGLQHNNGLVSLSLQECLDITGENGLLLATILGVNSTLKELDLMRNRLSTEGLQALGEGLVVNKGLKSVYLCTPDLKECWQAFVLKVNQARQKKSLPPLNMPT